MADGGEDDVGGIALAALEVAAAEVTVVVGLLSARRYPLFSHITSVRKPLRESSLEQAKARCRIRAPGRLSRFVPRSLDRDQMDRRPILNGVQNGGTRLQHCSSPARL